jgi:hypothetical protein
LFYEGIKATTELYFMKISNNIKMIFLVAFGILVLIIFNIKNSDFNLNRTISACLVVQKKISKSYDPVKAREFCKEEIKKKMEK